MHVLLGLASTFILMYIGLQNLAETPKGKDPGFWGGLVAWMDNGLSVTLLFPIIGYGVANFFLGFGIEKMQKLVFGANEQWQDIVLTVVAAWGAIVWYLLFGVPKWLYIGAWAFVGLCALYLVYLLRNKIKVTFKSFIK